MVCAFKGIVVPQQIIEDSGNKPMDAPGFYGTGPDPLCHLLDTVSHQQGLSLCLYVALSLSVCLLLRSLMSEALTSCQLTKCHPILTHNDDVVL